MRRMRDVAVFVILAFAVVGCAGRNFVRPDVSTEILGKTTSQDIIAKFGKPLGDESRRAKGKTYRSLVYTFSYGRGKAAQPGVTPAKAATFTLVDDVLVAHQFVSSFAADHTDFDARKIKRIRKGRTTRKQVVAMLGEPSGMQAYPLIKRKRGRGLVYSYTQYRQARGGKPASTYIKTLVVTLDRKGVVRKVDYSTSGKK